MRRRGRIPEVGGSNAVAAAVVLAPGIAWAQQITQTSGTNLTDVTPSGAVSDHPNSVDATWISYTDCEDDVRLEVPVTVTVPSSGFGSYVVRAYATTQSATDCWLAASVSPASGVCWQVGLLPGVPSATPVQSAVYTIPVRDLLRDINAPAGEGLAYVAGTEAACHVAKQSGVIPLSLQIVVSDLGGNEQSVPIDDFFDQYRGATGQAGGGYCALGHPRTAGTEAAGAGLLAVCVGIALRRRRGRAML